MLNLRMFALNAENSIIAIVAMLVCLAAALAMGLALWKSIDTVGKHPESAVRVRKILLLGLALIDSTAIFGFVMTLLIIAG